MIACIVFVLPYSIILGSISTCQGNKLTAQPRISEGAVHTSVFRQLFFCSRVFSQHRCKVGIAFPNDLVEFRFILQLNDFYSCSFISTHYMELAPLLLPLNRVCGNYSLRFPCKRVHAVLSSCLPAFPTGEQEHEK